MAPQERTMSSRLLNMKFMRRAAATALPSSPISHPSPSTPSSEPASKRQKISSSTSSPSFNQSPSIRPRPDADGGPVIATPATTATQDEEERHYEFLERQAQEAGDTKWTVSYRALSPSSISIDQMQENGNGVRVTKAGYGFLDRHSSASFSSPSPDHDNKDTDATSPHTQGKADTHRSPAGRQSFGLFNKTIETPPNPIINSNSSLLSPSSSRSPSPSHSSASGSSSPQHASSSSAAHQARAHLSARRKAKDSERSRMGGQRRSRSNEVNLNKLTSISGGGGGAGWTSSGGAGRSGGMQCFACGGTGHKKVDCPRIGGRRV